jgi:hypothetical protein
MNSGPEHTPPNTQIAITTRLGHGEDGTVWSTDAKTAIKAHRRFKNYRIELGCYQRLQAHAIREILGLAIPQLEGWDDDLGIVEPPRILDFGKAYLDYPPEYPPEVLEETEEKYREIWGEKWSTVAAILWKLARIGKTTRVSFLPRLKNGGPRRPPGRTRPSSRLGGRPWGERTRAVAGKRQGRDSGPFCAPCYSCYPIPTVLPIP